MTTQQQRDEAVLAARHAKLRWLGAPLLLTGVSLVIWAIVAAVGGSSAWTIGICMLGMGMGLATFGANNDTALSLAFQSVGQSGVLEALDRETDHGGPGLPVSLARELYEELEQDRAGVLALKPVPRIATSLPLVAVVVQGWALLRLLGG